MSKLFKGNVTNNVVELNLLDSAGTPTVITKNTGANEVIQIFGDIDSSKTGGYAGYGADSEGIVLGTSCTTIGSNSLGGNRYNCQLVIPDSVTRIDSFAFYFATDITGDLVIPDSVTWIGTSGLNYGDSAVFTGCTYGPNLTIGRNVKNIGQWDFGFNSNLTNVNCYIPKTVIDKSRDDEVFSGSNNIATIHARVNDATWTAGTNQTIGGVSGVEVIKDLVVVDECNGAPVLSPIANQISDESDVISLQVTATDPENDNLTYSAVGLPSGLSINSSTGLISGTISLGAESLSPYTVTITVTDDGSPIESTNEAFTWTVSAVSANQPPVLSPIGNKTNTESDIVSLQVSATDPENDNLTYSATGLPTGLSINSSTGLISGTISGGSAQLSPYTVTVTVTDDGSPAESDDEVFTWLVGVASNQPPVLSPIGNQTNDESDAVSLQVNATDPENDNLTYSATGLPTGLSINSSTGLISGNIDASGNTGSPYTTTVTVTDDGSPSESDSEVFTWTVNAVTLQADNKYYGTNDALLTTFSGDIPQFSAQQYPSLTRVEIGTSCTSIGFYGFGNSANLDGPLIVPNSVTSIGNYAFAASDSLVGPVLIPSSVTEIGRSAFSAVSNSHPIQELYLDVDSSVWSTNGAAFTVQSNQSGGSSPSLVIYVSSTHLASYDTTWRSDNKVSGAIVNWDNYPVATPN
jgi:hypothetical protein